jgi:hypothetical protein
MEALQHFGAADGLCGMLEWSEPVIFDCLREAYSASFNEATLVGWLTRQHCRAWRALIAGDMAMFEDLRAELVAALEELGLGFHCAADADARIMAELQEIVGARFQRCARLARGYRLALDELAERLAPAGQAAA